MESFLKLCLYVTFLLTIHHTLAESECCEDYCYTKDEDPYLFFATKTAYEFIHGRNSRQHIVPRCKPVQYWSINRHGTRLPSEETIKKLSAKLPQLQQEIITNYETRKSYPDKGRLCYEDLETLRNWKWNPNITDDHGDWLTDQGKDDLKYLAKRYQTRFPELLGIPYNEQDYVFKYSNTERIEESYKSFIEGLFGKDAYKVQGTPVNANDSVIGAYQTCDAFIEEKDKIKHDEHSEQKKFMERPEFQQMIKDVSLRLGFRYDLNFSSILIMYEICRYEKAWSVRTPSPWCVAFTKEQLRMLEYYADIKYYYETGYGNTMSARIGCTPVKELISYFEKIANNETNQPKAIAYFTHRATIQMLLVALEFEKDMYDLTADNYELAQKRQWRTAKISPFAANLAVIFYECPKIRERNIMFFLNEEPVEYPGCHVGLCSWQNVYERLKPIADNCNLDFCTKGAATRSTFTTITSLLCLIFVISIKNFVY